MKFKINQDHFSNGLQQVLNVVATRSTMPILSNVLIEAADGHISLTTTNLDLGIRCRIQADIQTPGGITLPVRKLATIVRELPQSDMLSKVATTIRPRSLPADLFKIMGIGTDEFPPLPTFENRHVFELEQAEIANMLKSVSYGQSSDENRYILNGVYMQFADEKLTLVATDGRRLALTALETDITEDNTDIPRTTPAA